MGIVPTQFLGGMANLSRSGEGCLLAYSGIDTYYGIAPMGAGLPPIYGVCLHSEMRMQVLSSLPGFMTPVGGSSYIWTVYTFCR